MLCSYSRSGLGLKGKKLRLPVSPKAFYKRFDEIGKTGLYVLEPHHQRLKRIAEFIIMSLI